MPTINEVAMKIENQLSDVFTSSEKRQITRMFLMHHLEKDATQLLLHRKEEMDKEIVGKIEKEIQRINSGEPVQYVLGITYFYGLALKTDSRALIPRPETEELVDWIIGIARKSTKKHRILDLGTGSGCIILALKENLPESRAVGVDFSQNALDLAKENAQKTGIDVLFQLGNALELEKTFKEKWDIIVSNPPYILEKERTEMAKHVVDFEPESALFVPNNTPLLFYEAIADYAVKYLEKDGFLFFEIHEKLAEKVKEMLEKKGFSNIEIRKDLQGKDRMVKACFS